MSGRPIAYVMEQTLGNITHYLNLRRAESMAEAPGPLWLPIEYRASRLPWTIAGGRLARAALINVMPQVDGIFMHTTTLALLCVDLFRKKPTVLSTDGTPSNKLNMRAAYGLQAQGRVRERAKRALNGKVYGAAAGLVGWSNWAKQSFVDDYGYREENIAVIPPGVDVEQFVAGDREHEVPRILFVGGDFERKGGSLLLDVFRQRLRGRAELILVTRDKVQPQPGVTVHHDIRANSPELRALYATSDLFVLPTLADCYSLVLMEALAAGMPVVATRVGGIPDIVLEGKNGHLLNAGDGAALGDALEALVADSGRRRSMGEYGRADALQRFDARENARRLFEFVRSHC
ncbi:MAG TPA: glycosyltransferase family 4 protein [Steroidobacteraceae bacterium]|jgi:glycosyltransferase involved in cell wall biosynthesis|nr:glycosyltransferase family 4 protein [Steroidobacteraceae bacterium]